MCRFVAAALAACLTVGCAEPYRAYDGPVRPRDAVATLVPNARDSGIGVVILQVDGRPAGITHRMAEVLPGERSLSLLLLPAPVAIDAELDRARYDHLRARGVQGVLSFHARPGVTYAFAGRVDSVTREVHYRLHDRASGRVVALGRAGPVPDEPPAPPPLPTSPER